MSVNRSVQAAQRRRAGPTNTPEPPRGPSTSINSAQMFASQARAGPGPSIPAGRLAAQQMSQSQQARMQQQQQHQQQKQQPETQDALGFSKMTIAQAITLITLRLGKVEQSIMEIEHREPGMSFSGSIDDSTVQSIMSRLESLERRPTTSPDVSLLKQQIDSMKPVVAQYKTSSSNLAKENGDLKNEVATLKDEIVQLREMLDSLRMDMETYLTSMVHIPTQEELNLSENMNFHVDEEEQEDMYMQGEDNVVDEETEYDEEQHTENVNEEEQVEIMTSEIVGTDLKQMIEQELNSTTVVDHNVEVEVEKESFSTMRQRRNRRR